MIHLISILNFTECLNCRFFQKFDIRLLEAHFCTDIQRIKFELFDESSITRV